MSSYSKYCLLFLFLALLHRNVISYGFCNTRLIFEESCKPPFGIWCKFPVQIAQLYGNDIYKSPYCEVESVREYCKYCELLAGQKSLDADSSDSSCDDYWK